MNKKLKFFNRSDIEKKLSESFPELSSSEISSSVSFVAKTIIEQVYLDKKIEIRGFGTFSKKSIRPRKFINPKTKQVSFIGETSLIHFKPSKSLLNK